MFDDVDLLHYAVSHEEIINNDISGVKDFFKRLSINDTLFRNSQGKVEISIDGYNNDKRELYEIKEVRRWFSKANKKITQWFFFLNTKPPSVGLIIFLVCNCRVKVLAESERMDAYEAVHALKSNNKMPKTQVELNISDLPEIMSINWVRLNEITDTLGMTMEENKTISLSINSLLQQQGILAK